MTNEEKFKFYRCVANIIGVEFSDLEDDDTLNSLGFDTLDEVELVLLLEEQYNIEINGEDLYPFLSALKLEDLANRFYNILDIRSL